MWHLISFFIVSNCYFICALLVRFPRSTAASKLFWKIDSVLGLKGPMMGEYCSWSVGQGNSRIDFFQTGLLLCSENLLGRSCLGCTSGSLAGLGEYPGVSRSYQSASRGRGGSVLDLRRAQLATRVMINIKLMIEKTSLPLFHFLFCELIEECYNNHKEDQYIEHLKKAGKDIGFKMYNMICIKKQITERPTSISGLVRNIQTKVFKHILGYEASSVYTASQDGQEGKEYFHVLVDNASVYLTWMPDNLWETSNLFSGIIEAICECSGLECSVSSHSKMETGDNIETEFFIKISEGENQRWGQE